MIPAATYVFKHALVRDAAYESLLKRRRQELHARIAAAFCIYFPNFAGKSGLGNGCFHLWNRDCVAAV